MRHQSYKSKVRGALICMVACMVSLSCGKSDFAGSTQVKKPTPIKTADPSPSIVNPTADAVPPTLPNQDKIDGVSDSTIAPPMQTPVPLKVECKEQLQYDPSEILCALNEVDQKTIWDVTGGCGLNWLHH